MLLVIDAGNTNVVFGLFEGDKLIKQFRMMTEKGYTADEYGIFILGVLNHSGIEPIFEGAAIASVVVKVVNPLKEAVKRYFNVEPIIVDASIDTGLIFKYDNPIELGPDRIVNAVAAFNLYKKAVIVVDFGTATTFCAVSSKGEFLGGAICPGINVSLEALAKKTSRLPGVEILKPFKAIGTNTVSNIQSGVYLGHVGQVEYIIKKFKLEMQESDVVVIATGGLAGFVAGSTESIDETQEYLTLEGLRIIYHSQTGANTHS